MFVTNAYNGTTVAETIRNLAKKSTRMDFLVGYFSIDGFAEIYESIGDKPIRILVGMNVTRGDAEDDYYFGGWRRNSEKRREDAEKAAKAVLFLTERVEKGQLEIRKTRRSNHSKMYLFSFQRVGAEGDHGRVLMGSSNLSRRGILARAEMNVVLASDSFDRALKAFEDLWRVATPITPGDTTPLGWASVFNNRNAVRKLLEKNINTALWAAAYEGDLNAVTLMIEKGASVNTKAEGGASALIVAIEKGHWSIAELLIEKGANVNVRDNVGNTALLMAIYNSYRWNLHIAKLLIEKGADVNVKTKKGWTVLMFMVSRAWVFGKENTLDVAKLLIKKGADINAKNKEGQTALMLAERVGNKEIVELLRGYEAKTQTNYSSSHITKPSTENSTKQGKNYENGYEVYLYLIFGGFILAVFLWAIFHAIFRFIFD